MFLKPEITASIGTRFCFVLFYFPSTKDKDGENIKSLGSLPLKSTKINGRVVKKMLNFMENQCTDQNTGEKQEIGIFRQQLQY